MFVSSSNQGRCVELAQNSNNTIECDVGGYMDCDCKYLHIHHTRILRVSNRIHAEMTQISVSASATCVTALAGSAAPRRTAPGWTSAGPGRAATSAAAASTAPASQSVQTRQGDCDMILSSCVYFILQS